MLAIDKSPKKWSDISYQDHIVKVYTQAIKDNKFPKNSLFIGNTGVGKTALSKIYASRIVCDTPNGVDPCGICPSCRDIFEDRFQKSVLYVNGILDNGIDFYRNLIKTFMNTVSFYNKPKVLSIDEVHGLSKESLQAFLLPIEKSDKDTYYIFATTEGSQIKSTLSGRCLSFPLKTPNELDISRLLVKVIQDLDTGVRIPNDFMTSGVFKIACESNGSIRSALHILEKIILSKDFTLKNIQEHLDFNLESDVIKFLNKLFQKDISLSLLQLDALILSIEPNALYNKLLRTSIDIYRLVGRGISFGKPYYDAFITSNFKSCDGVLPFIQCLYSIKKNSGYTIDKIVFYAIISEYILSLR